MNCKEYVYSEKDLIFRMKNEGYKTKEIALELSNKSEYKKNTIHRHINNLVSNDYKTDISNEEREVLENFRAFKQASKSQGLDVKDVKHGWFKTKDQSLFATNPAYEKQEFDPDKINWEEMFKDVKPIIVSKKKTGEFNGIFDRFVFTDTHIGMNPDKDGYSLYGGKWDEEELNNRLELITNHIYENQNSMTIIIDDLGDLMDGWNAQTVRKGHDLPQNMDNQKAFDVALRFKIGMINILMEMYDEIIINNVCMDNHSGSFGYVVNSAFKELVKALYPNNVQVNNLRKFINHYRILDNVFIITHGKDDVNLKFGFTPKLDSKQAEKINNYIDEHFLLQKGVRIEFSKGDSHQMLFDHSSSDRFDYFNYPALSPSSNWIQTNYQKGKSGVVFFNYIDTEEFYIKPLFFKWKNN